MADLTGGCLCGAVRFQATLENRELYLCHCTMCQRHAGGPEVSVDCGSDVRFEGREHIRVYRSSERSERAFCGTCGTILYFLEHDSGTYSIGPGLFDGDPGFRLTDEIYTDTRARWWPELPETRKQTEAQLKAKGG